MTMKARQHPAETLADLIAQASLAAAAGWAAWKLAGSAAAIGAAVGALAIGMFAMKRFGELAEELAGVGFEPVAFDDCTDEGDVLLLDDVLSELEDGSRVVRLFAKEQPTPGELVNRIAGYLGDDFEQCCASAG